jgi:hypothetical protein
VSEHKRNDASYNQLADNNNLQRQPHEDDGAPERPFEEAAQDYDNHDNRPKPAPNFKPFFTLIEDANSSDYHHPTVHYIFSDDDAELMTEASLRVLETNHPDHATSPRNDGEEGLESADQQSSHHLDNDRPSLLPPPIPGVKERFIVLDVEQTSATAIGNPSSAPDALLAGTSAGTGTTVVSTSPAQRQQQQQQQQPSGYRIVSAHSLTPDWQVLDASLSPAPTFDAPTGDQASVSNALMLRIEGTGGYARDIPVGKDKEGQQTLEEMMEQFDKRMAELRRVIETSGDSSPLGATATATAQPEFEEKGDEGEDDETGAGDGGGERHEDGGEEAVANQ